MYETDDSPKVKTAKRFKTSQFSTSTWSQPSSEMDLFASPIPQQQKVQSRIDPSKSMTCAGGLGEEICRPILPSSFVEVRKQEEDKSLLKEMSTFDIKTTKDTCGSDKRKQKERKNFKERRRRVATAEKFTQLSKLTKEITAGNVDPKSSCFDSKNEVILKAAKSNKLAILTDAVNAMQQLIKENRELKIECRNLRMRLSPADVLGSG